MAYADPTVDELKRFWEKVDKTGPNGCWIWKGYKVHGGYGGAWIGRRTLRAHRVAYELLVGPVPDDLHMDHLCRNPPCVNPEHLEPVTPKINALRGVGPSAVNARKTHCAEGHPLEGENLWINAAGQRNCRECKNRKQRQWAADHPEYLAVRRARWVPRSQR